MNTKILFIVSGLRKGGAETQMLKIARFLRSESYEVKIISLKPINDFNVDFKAEGLDVVFLKKWSHHPFSNISNLFKEVKLFAPEQVIAFMFIAIIFARLLKMYFGFQLISSIRTPIISKKWYLPFKITAAADDIVIYNSYKSKSNFERKNLVKKDGLVINNAITIPVRTGDSPSNILGNKPFVWISMAHFVPEKDYMTLFKAISLIKNYPFRIDVLGNLFDQKWPFQIIEQLGIAHHVRLLGLQTETIGYLTASDGFVLSSFLEGMPNALLEAMAYEKPIIASSVDGIQELLENINCGFLFKQGDEVALAEKMMCIMKMSAKERFALGQQGRKHIEQNFSEEKVFQDWLSLVQQFSKNKVNSTPELLPR